MIFSQTVMDKRGFRVIRCEKCRVPKVACLCHIVPVIETKAHFWILMYWQEFTKPTNTGKLIEDSIANTKIFAWDRKEPNQEFLTLLNDPKYQPYIVFPDDVEEYKPRVTTFEASDKIPAFIILDGTWNQARKIFRKSPYMDHLPLLPLRTKKESEYGLRRPSDKTHLCTVEVAAELLNVAGENQASEQLYSYFRGFLTHYLAGRNNHAVKSNIE